MSFNSNPAITTTNLNNFLTVFLFPFAVLYDIVTRVRNLFYNVGIFKSSTASIKTICVGNIRVGGTGKSPFVEYLLRNSIKKNIRTGTLSRGYGRTSKGFLKANKTTLSSDIGDESFQYFKKFGDKIAVYVDEKRAHGVDLIKTQQSEIELIILDDAYQHRSFTSDYNILLTEYARPFFNDFLLPMGRLREARVGAKRADCVIVTKCPEYVSAKEKLDFTIKINKCTTPNTPIFFTEIAYSNPQALFDASLQINDYKNVVIVCGIDNPLPFIDFCKKKYNVVDVLIFPDHYAFNESDIDKMTQDKYKECAILTTEKDTSRLLLHAKKLEYRSVFYLPIEVKFVENENAFVSLLDKWTSV